MDRLAVLARERRTSSSALVREFVARGLAQEERLLATARFERVLSHLLASNVPDGVIEQARAIFFEGGAL